MNRPPYTGRNRRHWIDTLLAIVTVLSIAFMFGMALWKYLSVSAG